MAGIPLDWLHFAGDRGDHIGRDSKHVGMPTTTISWWIVPGLALSLVALAAAIGLAARALTTVTFHEHAATRRLLGRTLVIPYVDATVLTYSLVRQQIHGIPAGTIATIKLQAADKRRISFSGAYRPRGGFLLAGVRVDAKVDPLDIMRDRISRVIAERLADDLLNSLPVRWGPLSMTATAVTPNRGKHKGQARFHFGNRPRRRGGAGPVHSVPRGGQAGLHYHSHVRPELLAMLHAVPPHDGR